jgi:hypothetical protein
VDVREVLEELDRLAISIFYRSRGREAARTDRPQWRAA